MTRKRAAFSCCDENPNVYRARGDGGVYYAVYDAFGRWEVSFQKEGRTEIQILGVTATFPEASRLATAHANQP